MPRKRLHPNSLLIILLLAIMSLIAVKSEFNKAYEVCKNNMVAVEGYGPWKYEDSIFLIFYADIAFDDGYNTYNCTAQGIGKYWHVTGTMQTSVACMQALDGPECPREEFGVIP